MIRRTAEIVLSSGIRPVLAVTGHDAGEITDALMDLPLAIHHVPDFAEGMSASLKTGIAALPADCGAALVCLGDMPFVRPDTLNRLAAAFDPLSQRALVPVFQGKRGNPVLLSRSLFIAISHLSGDKGARALLKAIPEHVGEITVDDPGILLDIDRPDALSDDR